MLTSRVVVSGVLMAVSAAMVPLHLPPATAPEKKPGANMTVSPISTSAPLDATSARLVALAALLGENSYADPVVSSWRNRPSGQPPLILQSIIAQWRSTRAEILHLVGEMDYAGMVDLDDGHIPTAAEIKSLMAGRMPTEVINALSRCGRACADSLRDDPEGKADLAAGDALIASTQRNGTVVSALLNISLRSLIGQAQVDRAGIRGFEPGITDYVPGSLPVMTAVAQACRHEANAYARPFLRFVLAAPAGEVQDWVQTVVDQPVTEITLVSRTLMALMAASEMHQTLQISDLLEGLPTKESPVYTPVRNRALALVAKQAFTAAISAQEQQIAADLLRRRQEGEDLPTISGTEPGPVGTIIRWQTLPDRIRVDLAPDSPLPSFITDPAKLLSKAAESPKPGRSGMIHSGLVREILVTPTSLPRGVQ